MAQGSCRGPMETQIYALSAKKTSLKLGPPRPSNLRLSNGKEIVPGDEVLDDISRREGTGAWWKRMLGVDNLASHLS